MPIPPLNEERRRDLVKLVKRFGEEAKIALRNVRRDANEHLKKPRKTSTPPRTSARRPLTQVQELTDHHIEEINAALKKKEAEIMEV